MDQTLLPVKLDEATRLAWRALLRDRSGEDPSSRMFATELATAGGMPDTKSFRQQVSRFVNGRGEALLTAFHDEDWRRAVEAVLGDPTEIERWLMQRVVPRADRPLSADDLVGIDLLMRVGGTVLRRSTLPDPTAAPPNAAVDAQLEALVKEPRVGLDEQHWRRLLRDSSDITWTEPPTDRDRRSGSAASQPKPPEVTLLGVDAASVAAWIGELVRRGRVTEAEGRRITDTVGATSDEGDEQFSDVVRSPDDLVDALEAARRGQLTGRTSRDLRHALADALVARWIERTRSDALRTWMLGAPSVLEAWIEAAGALDAPLLEHRSRPVLRSTPKRIDPERLHAAIAALLSDDADRRRDEARHLGAATEAPAFEALIEAGLLVYEHGRVSLADEFRRWADLRIPLELTPKDVARLARNPDGLRWIGDAVRLATDLRGWIDAALAVEVEQPEVALTVLDAVVARTRVPLQDRGHVHRLWASAVWMVLHGLHEQTVSWNDWNLGHDRRLVAASERLVDVLPNLGAEPYAGLRRLVPNEVARRVTAWRRDPSANVASDKEEADDASRFTPKVAYRDVGEALRGLVDLAPFQVAGELVLRTHAERFPSDVRTRLLRFHADRGSVQTRRVLLGAHRVDARWWMAATELPDVTRWQWIVEDPELLPHVLVSLVRELILAPDDAVPAQTRCDLLAAVGERLSPEFDAAIACAVYRATHDAMTFETVSGWMFDPESPLGETTIRRAVTAIVGASEDFDRLHDPLETWFATASAEHVVHAVRALGRTHVLKVWADPPAGFVERAAHAARWTGPDPRISFPALDRVAALRHHAQINLVSIGADEETLRVSRVPWRVTSPAIAEARGLGAMFAELYATTGLYAPSRTPISLDSSARLGLAACALGLSEERAPVTMEWVAFMVEHYRQQSESDRSAPTRSPVALAIAALLGDQAPVQAALAPLLDLLWTRRHDPRLTPLLDAVRPNVTPLLEEFARADSPDQAAWEEPWHHALTREESLLRVGDREVLDAWVALADTSDAWHLAERDRYRYERLVSLTGADSGVARSVLPRLSPGVVRAWAERLGRGPVPDAWWTEAYALLSPYARVSFARAHGDDARVRAAEQAWVGAASQALDKLKCLARATTWTPADLGRSILVPALDDLLAQPDDHDFCDVLDALAHVLIRVDLSDAGAWVVRDFGPRVADLLARASEQAGTWKERTWAYVEEAFGVGSWLVNVGSYDPERVAELLHRFPRALERWRQDHPLVVSPMQLATEALEVFDALGKTPESGGVPTAIFDKAWMAAVRADRDVADEVLRAVSTKDSRTATIEQARLLFLYARTADPELGHSIGVWVAERVRLKTNDQRQQWSELVRDTAAWSKNPGLAAALRPKLRSALQSSGAARRDANL